MNAVFKIVNHADVAKVSHFVATHHMKAFADGHPLVVKIGTKDEQRSHAQNRLYWLWLTQFGYETGNDKDYWHFQFKYKYLIRIYMRDDEEFNAMCLAIADVRKYLGESEQFRAIRDGVIRETSTTRASVKQMTEYLNCIYDFCLLQGCQLKIPDDLRWCYEYQR